MWLSKLCLMYKGYEESRCRYKLVPFVVVYACVYMWIFIFLEYSILLYCIVIIENNWHLCAKFMHFQKASLCSCVKIYEALRKLWGICRKLKIPYVIRKSIQHVKTYIYNKIYSFLYREQGKFSVNILFFLQEWSFKKYWKNKIKASRLYHVNYL